MLVDDCSPPPGSLKMDQDTCIIHHACVHLRCTCHTPALLHQAEKVALTRYTFTPKKCLEGVLCSWCGARCTHTVAEVDDVDTYHDNLLLLLDFYNTYDSLELNPLLTYSTHISLLSWVLEASRCRLFFLLYVGLCMAVSTSISRRHRTEESNFTPDQHIYIYKLTYMYSISLKRNK
jgi:hypothetical protein